MSSDTPSKKLGQLSRSRLVEVLVQRFHEAEQVWPDERARRAALQGIRELLIAHAHEPFIGRLAQHLDPDRITLEQLYTLLVPIERECEVLNLRDEDFLPSGEREVVALARMPVSVVLDNLRSAFNVGGLFRTCECMGIGDVMCAGYTATPAHPKVQKAALGSASSVDWRVIDGAAAGLDAGGKSIALEQSDRSISLYDYRFEFPCVLVLGNERFGLNPSVVDAVDDVVHIPMHGSKHSLNVVAAFAMCAYEMRRQFDAGC